MKKLFLLLPLLWSCEEPAKIYPEPCIDCTVEWTIDTIQHAGTYFDGEFWNVPYSGMQYFQVIGQTDSLHSDYIINGIPLIEVVFDSDTWYVFDTISMNIPLYSPFTSQYTTPTWAFPLPSGDTTILITNPNFIINSVGYTYGSTNFVKSYHTYRPRCEVLVFEEMKGDTIEVYSKTVYNYDLVGKRKEVFDTVKVIIK
jgi:hypothetical protein